MKNLPSLSQELADIEENDAISVANAINIWCRTQKYQPLKQTMAAITTPVREDMEDIPATDPEMARRIKENIVRLKKTLDETTLPPAG